MQCSGLRQNCKEISWKILDKGRINYITYFLLPHEEVMAWSECSPARCSWIKENKLQALISSPFDSIEMERLTLMHQLDWDIWHPDYTLFTRCFSITVFPDEINIFIGELSKADCPLQHGWASSLQWWPKWRKKVREIVTSLPDYELTHQSSALNWDLNLWPSGSQEYITTNFIRLLSPHNYMA